MRTLIAYFHPGMSLFLPWALLLLSCEEARIDPIDDFALDVDSDMDVDTDSHSEPGYVVEPDTAADAPDQPTRVPAIVDSDAMKAALGPADQLLIDGDVYTGYPWGGEEYEGLRGDTFEFNMSDYPVTWAIAAVHTSMLLQSRGFDVEPNTVLALSLRVSGMNCQDEETAPHTGCFQLEPATDYLDLTTLFPENYSLPFSDLLGRNRFETAALSIFFHWLALDGMLAIHTDDSELFFARHPDPDAHLKALLAAEKQGIWWGGIPNLFADCGSRDVEECFYNESITIDHVRSIVAYTDGLNRATRYDPEITVVDLLQYWDAIRDLYPGVDADQMTAGLETAFAEVLRGADRGSFQANIRPLLIHLMTWLPPVPSEAEINSRICEVYGDNMPESACNETL